MMSMRRAASTAAIARWPVWGDPDTTRPTGGSGPALGLRCQAEVGVVKDAGGVEFPPVQQLLKETFVARDFLVGLIDDGLVGRRGQAVGLHRHREPRFGHLQTA